MTQQLRSGKPEDAARCGAICFSAFAAIAQAHAFPPDFPSPDVAVGLMADLFSREDVFSVVAEIDGDVIGSNFLWEGGPIVGIGPITIDPSVQDRKVGHALMEHVLQRGRSRNAAGIRLVQAAYHNRSLSLYARLGFEAREPLSVLQGSAVNAKVPGYPVRAAVPSDLDACNRLCLQVHGHERAGELRDAIDQGTASVAAHDGRIVAYATAIGFFGHAVAENNTGMKALIGAAPAFAGPGFLLPTRNGELLRWCLERGLRIVQPMTLMSIGLYQQPEGSFLPSVLY
ncbi:Acetyltransferase (GNAT) family [Cupriavidus necator]|uniref:GNAT family N-acetyltransferase n=1 Tax=Cupriavidus necator TaxID=106590 RepID=UPI003F73E379